MSYPKKLSVFQARFLNHLAYVLLAIAVLGAGCQSTAPGSVVPGTSTPTLGQTVASNVSSTALTPIKADVFLPRDVLATLGSPETASPTKRCAQAAGARAGLVNHHTLAAPLMADFFSELKHCRPEARTFIVLSPDHFQQAQAPIIITRRPYLTRGSQVKADEQGVARLLAQVPDSREQDAAFDDEHGLGAVVPFLAAAYRPAEITLVPVMVNQHLTQTQAQGLSNWLKQEMASGTLVVVSADMSHYQNRAVALENDVLTRRAFATGDAEFFWTAGDGYTDSGKTLWSVLQALKNASWHELAHSISTNYGGDPANTTSYVTGFWE